MKQTKEVKAVLKEIDKRTRRIRKNMKLEKSFSYIGQIANDHRRSRLGALSSLRNFITKPKNK